MAVPIISWLAGFVEDLISDENQSPKADIKKLLQELIDYKAQHKKMLESDDKTANKIKEIDTNCFETLAKENNQAADALIKLAKQTKPLSMAGNQFALFGLTAIGKSTMVNKFLGEDKIKTGIGDATTKITPYPSINFVVWDMPGRNDETPYMTMQYISFLKGLTRRLILIRRTVKENSSLMKFLDAMELDYAIVVNQFDLIKDEEEREKFRKQIKNDIVELKLKQVNGLFFVSAQYPRKYDWLELIKFLSI